MWWVSFQCEKWCCKFTYEKWCWNFKRFREFSFPIDGRWVSRVVWRGNTDWSTIGFWPDLPRIYPGGIEAAGWTHQRSNQRYSSVAEESHLFVSSSSITDDRDNPQHSWVAGLLALRFECLDLHWRPSTSPGQLLVPPTHRHLHLLRDCR